MTVRRRTTSTAALLALAASLTPACGGAPDLAKEMA